MESLILESIELEKVARDLHIILAWDRKTINRKEIGAKMQIDKIMSADGIRYICPARLTGAEIQDATEIYEAWEDGRLTTQEMTDRINKRLRVYK